MFNARFFVIVFAIFAVFTVSPKPAKAVLDTESIDCMSCHDAAIASDVTITSPQAPYFNMG